MGVSIPQHANLAQQRIQRRAILIRTWVECTCIHAISGGTGRWRLFQRSSISGRTVGSTRSNNTAGNVRNHSDTACWLAWHGFAYNKPSVHNILTSSLTVPI